MNPTPEASPGVRWRADARWQLWPGSAAVAEDVVVTCERWTRLVARRLDDGAVVWDRLCVGRRNPVVVGDAVVVRAGDSDVHSYALHDGAPRWRRGDLQGVRLLTPASPTGPLTLGGGAGNPRPVPTVPSALMSLAAASGHPCWERRLPGPLAVLSLGDVVLAGETESMTWTGIEPSFVHRWNTELVALDSATGQTRQRWTMPASVRVLAAASPTEILAICADGSNLRLWLTSEEMQRLPSSPAASSLMQPTLVAGRWWGGAADVNGGLLVVNPGTLEPVAHLLPTHRIAQGLVPVGSGVLVGTQEAVVHHLDPGGKPLGRIHLREKRLHGLLRVPRGRSDDGPVAVALTKSGLVAIDLSSP